MKLDWGTVAVAAVLAFGAGLMLTEAVGGRGRYQIAPLSAGVVARMDTRTGAISGCRTSADLFPAFDCSAPMR